MTRFLLAFLLFLSLSQLSISPTLAVCQPTGSAAAGAIAGMSSCPSTPNLSCTDVDNECPCDLTGITPQGQAECKKCMGGETNVWTAIGCLSAGNPVAGGGIAGASFIGQVLGWGVFAGVGVAFLLIAFSGFQITTAAGDPKKMQAATELLWAAVSGLLLILFSLFLLNLIGVKILNLPGFLKPRA